MPELRARAGLICQNSSTNIYHICDWESVSEPLYSEMRLRKKRLPEDDSKALFTSTLGIFRFTIEKINFENVAFAPVCDRKCGNIFPAVMNHINMMPCIDCNNQHALSMMERKMHEYVERVIFLY